MLTVLPRDCPRCVAERRVALERHTTPTAYATVALHRTAGHRDRTAAHSLYRTGRPAVPLEVDALRARRMGGTCPATLEQNIPSRPSDDGPRRARRRTPLGTRCARYVRPAPVHRLHKPARGRGWIGDSDRRTGGCARAEPSNTRPLDHSAIAVESSPATITRRPLVGAVVLALMARRTRSTALPSQRPSAATTGELGVLASRLGRSGPGASRLAAGGARPGRGNQWPRLARRPARPERDGIRVQAADGDLHTSPARASADPGGSKRSTSNPTGADARV
jgi:hypothetical protein